MTFRYLVLAVWALLICLSTVSPSYANNDEFDLSLMYGVFSDTKTDLLNSQDVQRILSNDPTCKLTGTDVAVTDGEVTARLGMLVCGNDTASGTITPILVQCEITSYGWGQACSGTLWKASTDISDGNGGTVNVAFDALTAQECTAMGGAESSGGICLGATADVAKVYAGHTDAYGNSIEVGGGVGIGASGVLTAENGMLTFGIDLKLGIGFSFKVSVNLQKVADDIIATHGQPDCQDDWWNNFLNAIGLGYACRFNAI